MKAIVFLCVALCVSAAAAAAPKKGESTWFSDYLENVPKVKAASAYEEVDTADVCFRTSTYCERKCDLGGADCDSSTAINTLMCSSCPEEEEYSRERPDRDYYPEMGLSLVGSKCMINKQYTTAVGLAGKPGINFVGTFTGTCYLMESKDHSCNMPETCEYVVASIQGVIYRANKAVRVGPASAKLEACIPESTAAKAAGYPDDEFPNYPDYDVTPGIPSSPLANVGPAEILSGPFTLHGVGHKLKYTSGHFQHSSFHNVTLSADTQGRPRLGDDVYKFEFMADKHY